VAIQSIRHPASQREQAFGHLACGAIAGDCRRNHTYDPVSSILTPFIGFHAPSTQRGTRLALVFRARSLSMLFIVHFRHR
jgi:hypothetical protein